LLEPSVEMVVTRAHGDRKGCPGSVGDPFALAS
jgi:hypothetical protein